MALMEAMAVGLPVITTTVAGIPELVDHTVGWLVPPDREDGLGCAETRWTQGSGERAVRPAGLGLLVMSGLWSDRPARCLRFGVR